jgi:hypothetical protein
MTAEAMAVPARFDVGRAIAEALAATRRNAVTLGLLALAFGALPAWLVGLASQAAGMAPNESGGNLAVNLVGVVLSAAVIHVIVGERFGRKLTFGQALSRAVRLFLPMIGIGVLSGLAIMVGLILLVVPGVIVAVGLSVAAPARALEGPGVTRALQRSWDLTRGHRWRLFAFFALLWGGLLLVALALGVLVGLAGLFQETNSYADLIAESLISGVIAVAPPIFAAVAYLELRRANEGGVALEGLAEVFS